MQHARTATPGDLVRSLKSTDYLNAFAAYDAASTERSVALQALAPLASSLGRASRRVLCVGPADGVHDLQILRRLLGHQQAAEIDWIEPNALYAERLATYLQGARDPTRKDRLLVRRFEDHHPHEALYDLILASHSLYYLQDEDGVADKMARLLRPGGTVVAIVNGERGARPIYDFFLTTVLRRPTSGGWEPARIVAACANQGLQVSLTPILARIDLGPSAPKRAPIDPALLNLFINADSTSLHRESRRLLEAYITDLAHDDDGRLILEQQVAIITARRP